MMAASVIFHLTGVDKRRFLEGVAADPQTYADWSIGGEWDVATDGKEDEMYSPFLAKPFRRAIADGLLPETLQTIGGTWGAVHDSGELTYLNLVHLDGVDGTDPDAMARAEIEGRRQVGETIRAMRAYVPGCENAKLRNLGATLGVRDTRKLQSVYEMMACCVVTGQGAGVAAAQAARRAVDPSEVDLGEVGRELVAQGVRIG
jgi:hypothetical protein